MPSTERILSLKKSSVKLKSSYLLSDVLLALFDVKLRLQIWPELVQKKACILGVFPEFWQISLKFLQN